MSYSRRHRGVQDNLGEDMDRGRGCDGTGAAGRLKHSALAWDAWAVFQTPPTDRSRFDEFAARNQS